MAATERHSDCAVVAPEARLVYWASVAVAEFVVEATTAVTAVAEDAGVAVGVVVVVVVVVVAAAAAVAVVVVVVVVVVAAADAFVVDGGQLLDPMHVDRHLLLP